MQAEQTFETVRSALARLLSPLVSWIPDVTAFPRKRQVTIAAVASILFHLLIVLVFVIHGLVWPARVEPMPPPTPAAPLQVTVVQKPQPRNEEDPLVKARRQILDAKGLDASQVKPNDAQFESDKDMIAASQLPATGILPLPSQQGRTDLPGHDFADQDVRIGVIPEPTPETLRPPDPTADQTPAGAPPVPAPLFTPQPVAPDALSAADKAKPAEDLPEPAKTAKATPPPFKISDKPENTIAMLTATPVPRAMATPAPPPAPMPAPRPSIMDRYQTAMRKTGVEGNIVNKGKAGVNAVNSPMGRYNRRLSQQIESLWTLKRQGQIGELGTVRISVRLRSDGTVESAKVLDNGGSPQHTEICLQVIRDMRPEKMPPEAEPMLEDGSMEITFSFTLF